MSSRRFIQLVALLGAPGAIACSPVEPTALGPCVAEDVSLCTTQNPGEIPVDSGLHSEVGR